MRKFSPLALSVTSLVALLSAAGCSSSDSGGGDDPAPFVPGGGGTSSAAGAGGATGTGTGGAGPVGSAGTTSEGQGGSTRTRLNYSVLRAMDSQPGNSKIWLNSLIIPIIRPPCRRWAALRTSAFYQGYVWPPV